MRYKEPPIKRCKNKFRHRWKDKGRFYGDTWTFICANGCGCEAIKQDSFEWSYYKDGVTYSRAPECVDRKLTPNTINTK